MEKYSCKIISIEDIHQMQQSVPSDNIYETSIVDNNFPVEGAASVDG